MFRSPTHWRAIAGGVVLAAALGVAPAQAATTTTVVDVDAQCRFPQIGVQPVRATITTTAPESTVFGFPSDDATQVQLTLVGPGLQDPAFRREFGAGLNVVVHEIERVGPSDPAKDLSGRITFGSALPASASASTSTTVFVPIAPNGLSRAGTTATVDGLTLTEALLDGNGNPVLLPRVTTDVDGNPWTPSSAGETIPCKITPTSSELWRIKGSFFGPPFAVPGGLGVDAVESTTATVRWTATLGFGAGAPNSYLVRAVDPEGVDAPHEVVVPRKQTTATLTGLLPDHTYTFTVADYRPANQRETQELGQASDPFSFRTKPVSDPPPFPLGWKIVGSAGLARGNAALSGSLVGLDLGAASSSGGALSLNPTAARLVSSGLPITAALSFVPVGTASSTRTGDSVTLTADVRVKVAQAKLFGLALVSGSTCQSSKVVPLALTGPVTRTGGGTLTGPITVPPLTGCGAFNGIVSSVVAGKGRGVSLTPSLPIG